MATLLHYLSPVEHHDMVCVSHRRQPMGHHNHRLSTERLSQILRNQTLILGIQRISSLIKKDVFRLALESTGYQQALTLSLTQTMTVSPDKRVQP